MFDIKKKLTLIVVETPIVGDTVIYMYVILSVCR